MKARPKVAFAGLIATMLMGCSTAAAPSGVLTGKAWPCIGIVITGHSLPQATVSVYSGVHLVATQKVAAGGTYRLKLHPGRYLVTNAGRDIPSSSAHEVSLSSRSVTRVNLPDLCP